MTTRDANGDDTPPATLGGVVKLLAARTGTNERALEELQRNARLSAEGVERLEGMLPGIMRELGSLSTKVEDLERDVRHALKAASMPPPPPAMRAELPSHVDVRELARAIKNATLEGERRPDTTPDEQVDRVLERVVVMKAGRGALKVLWLALAGAASLGAEHLITALFH